MRKIYAAVAIPAASLFASQANAIPVTLTGTVANMCTLTATNGVLTMDATGTVLSSENVGGIAANLKVVATGSNPTIIFTSPYLDLYLGSFNASDVTLKYTSTRGANQPYTFNPSSYTEIGLLDDFTIHGKVTHSVGFVAATYSMVTDVTCQQA